MLPAAVLLALHGAVFTSMVYAASAVVATLYHWHHEARFVETDQALAWAVIATNAVLCLESGDIRWSSAGIVAVLVALVCFRLARTRPLAYVRWHSLWHGMSGLACFCFAKGFLA